MLRTEIWLRLCQFFNHRTGVYGADFNHRMYGRFRAVAVPVYGALYSFIYDIDGPHGTSCCFVSARFWSLE